MLRVSARNQGWPAPKGRRTEESQARQRATRPLTARLGGAVRLAAALGTAMVLVLSAQVLASERTGRLRRVTSSAY